MKKYNILISLSLFCLISHAQTFTFSDVLVGDAGAAMRTKINSAIDYSSIEYTRKYWAGKKPVFIGDSQTAQGDDDPISWINTLCGLMGWSYAVAQNMGVAGSGLMPYNDLSTVGDNSIYKRCDDVDLQSPDIIFIMGGENDDPNLTITAGEATYTGATLSTVGYSGPGIIGAMKGCLKKLRDQNPNAVIVLMTNMLRYADGETTNQKKLNRNLAFQKECGLFNVVFLPIYEVKNISNVHPPPSEGQIIGQWIARQRF